MGIGEVGDWVALCLGTWDPVVDQDGTREWIGPLFVDIREKVGPLP